MGTRRVRLSILKSNLATLSLLFCTTAIQTPSAWALKSELKSFESFDGFQLEGIVEWPEGKKRGQVEKVLVFVHGSGAQGMDEDLSELTAPKGTANPFFKTLGAEVVAQGWGTLRYNKRNFQFNKAIQADANIQKAKHFLKFAKKPLEHFIRDTMAMAVAAKKEFPQAEIFVLGHSEGANVALQASRRQPLIKGHVLIGFTNEGLATTLLEQTVYRPLHYFSSLDKDLNQILEPSELNAQGDLAKSLREQMPVLDLNGDKKLSVDEFKAGNYSNLIASSAPKIGDYVQEETKLARPSEILFASKKKTLFLQGTYDNQTPVYFAQSLDLTNRRSWKKKNLHFVYFEKAGHALDPRTDINDLNYRVISKESLTRVGNEIQTFFRQP